jgi:hypothetical protein
VIVIGFILGGVIFRALHDGGIIDFNILEFLTAK